MSTFLQFAIPFVTALLLLGIFNLVAAVHIQLSETDQIEDPGSEAGAGSERVPVIRS